MAKVKGKGKKQKLVINEKGGSSEEENKGDKPCTHVNKAVRYQSLKKVLPHAKTGECKDCRGKPKLTPELKDVEDGELMQSICICLKCGFQGCSRNSQNRHAHCHFQQQASHTICINTTTWVIWCYACDKELNNVSENSDIQKTIKFIRERNTTKNGAKENDEITSCVAGAVKGLRNLGNTCFFNSVLQNISRATVLVEKLDSLLEKENEVKIQNNKTPKIEITVKRSSAVGPLTSALKSFLDEFHSSSRGVVTPSRLFGEITKKSPQFRGYRQQDSQELLRYLLDGMRVEELKRIESAVKDAVKKLDCPPTNEQLKDCFKNVKTFVDDVFGGMLVSTIVCSECKSKSQVYESFFELSLPVNTTPETAKAAATRLFSGKIKNEDKAQTDPDVENQRKLSKHQMKVMAKKDKKAKRGKGKGAPSPKRKGSEASSDLSSGKQNSDDDHEEESDDCNENDSTENNDSASTKASCKEGLKQGEKQREDDSNSYTIKDEEDFVIIEKKTNACAAIDESKSWESSNQAMLGGQSTHYRGSQTSSLESLASKESTLYSRQNTYGGSNSNFSSKEDVSKVDTEINEKEKERIEGHNSVAPTSGNINDTVTPQEEDASMSDTEARKNAGEKAAKSQVQDKVIEDTICMLLVKECNIDERERKENQEAVNGEAASQTSEENLNSRKGLEKDCKGVEVGEEARKETENGGQEGSKDKQTEVSLFSNEHRENVEMKQEGATTVNDGIEEKETNEKEDSQGNDSESVEEVTEQHSEDDNGSDEEEMKSNNVSTFSPEYKCKSGECSILSCLHQFTAKDVLEGNNRFRCDECTKKRNEVIQVEEGKANAIKPVFTDATKQMLVWQPPSVLTLHLKRFEQVGRGLRKVNKHIEFPLQLDLSSFCHVNKSVSKEDLQYNLFGIIEHSGNLHSGHYVACVKTRTIDNKFKWYYVSDSRVSEIQEEAVLKKQAYVLFYHQISRRGGKVDNDK
ncbi:ubiquitin carboxyl-terminal hydrolase 16-like isoform X2 [Rhopilema esculentum]|uniref:ubiquitin carboxyl-terminal hydrolase 16-like isoform X2 n=1 Tax=Rhopilema esculentum TaxID=499914 RepID=UPI0031D77A16